MRTTVELPDDLLSAAQAVADREGTSLQEILTRALREHLQFRSAEEKVPRGKEPWRRSFGTVDPREIEAVDEVFAADENLRADL